MSGLATAKSRKHRSASPGIMRGGALSSPEGALAASDPCVPRSSPVPVGLWQASRDFAAEESGGGGQGEPDRAHAPQARRPEVMVYLAVLKDLEALDLRISLVLSTNEP